MFNLVTHIRVYMNVVLETCFSKRRLFVCKHEVALNFLRPVFLFSFIIIQLVLHPTLHHSSRTSLVMLLKRHVVLYSSNLLRVSPLSATVALRSTRRRATASVFSRGSCRVQCEVCLSLLCTRVPVTVTDVRLHKHHHGEDQLCEFQQFICST